MDTSKDAVPRAPPSGGSWLIPLGFFLLLGILAAGIPVGKLCGGVATSFASTWLFLCSLGYRRKRFSRRGGTIHPAFEDEERKSDRFIAGLVLPLTIFVPESIPYVLGATAVSVATSWLFIR